jgi:regulator of sigma E protease
MNWLSYIPAFAALLGIVVVIHELGHYWVAKWCGVKVLRFSVGFGKPLVSKRVGPDHTEWALGAFPLGGYVKMLDEREAPVAEHELHRAFNRQSVGKRIAIVVAGPLANLLLAILLFWGLFVVGVAGPQPILGDVEKGSAAQASGFVSGEKIVAVEGDPIKTWQEVGWAFTTRLGRETIAVITEDSGGTQRERIVDMAGVNDRDLESDVLGKLGLQRVRPGVQIVEVIPNSPALRAGFLAGDEVVSIAQKKVTGGAHQFIGVIQVNVGNALQVEVKRQGRLIQLSVVPEIARDRSSKVGVIGAKVGEVDQPQMRALASYSLPLAFTKAIAKTWDMSWLSLKSLWRMLTGEMSIKNLSGPVTIANYAGQTAQMGLIQFISFVAVISISLGILNLLPIPLLDGGHLMYYIAEIIKGSPVSERFMEMGQQVGLALLIGLMAIAFYNDINRLITG